VITGRVEVTDVRADKPVTTLAVSVSRDDGTVALSGTAVLLDGAAPRPGVVHRKLTAAFRAL